LRHCAWRIDRNDPDWHSKFSFRQSIKSDFRV
jgi:hypothetical protein